MEDIEARWVTGEPIPLQDYLACINVQRRVLATLGLERLARDVTPTVDAYLKAARSRETEDADEDAA